MSDELRILVIKEGDVFVAQCLEYDICTQANSFGEVERRMDVLLGLECRAGLNETGSEFGHIDAAPDEFHKMWDSAKAFEKSESGHRMAMAA
ncbi:MAG: hypothetical protein ACFB03_19550 [Paracoccaceae bacterium]